MQTIELSVNELEMSELENTISRQKEKISRLQSSNDELQERLERREMENVQEQVYMHLYSIAEFCTRVI